jgi:lipopolysaccharide cholinephosphotransferase
VKELLMIACKAIGSEYFIRGIIKAAALEDQENSSYVGCKSWCIYGEREIIPAEVFVDTIEVTFEGIKFPAPIGYDAYLRSLYGDYEKDPPIEQQKTHHNFKAYCL